ncbi:GNAT family N-acetyltransferase [Nocardioides sp. GXQ0305]|uniref:GNAT family N-acetyltransferase n=1 Tax=Nocardioides sp. GXQ0305 TaxID=3423912 RepID=UPI003D7D79F8
MATAEGIDGGNGVLLRPAVAGDAVRWLELLHDPDHRRYASPAFVEVPADVDALAERLAGSAAAWSESAPGTLVVVAPETPEVFLGDIGWRWSTGERLAAADLGYGVHPDARGRGLARRALVALTRWLLAPDGRGLARVQLDHSTENPASCRVALAAGFEREGIRRGYLPLRDPDGSVRRHDVCLHGTVTPPP